mgnify:CR=1 FL=1
MKKIVIALVITIVFMTVLASTALADNGPHGGYATITDACGGCHRAHTATASKLLLDTGTYDLCVTCHGTTGSGADTNVLGGIYLQRDSDTEVPLEGVANRGLKSGGFTNTFMDTDLSGAAASVAMTSSHTPNGTGTIWGDGALNSGTGTAAFALTCGNCHDPHGQANGGTATYRILRPVPTGSLSAAVPVTDVADFTNTYTISSATGNYFGETYGATLDGQMSDWCATCHDRYLTGEDGGNTDSTDADFAFRHMSDGSTAGTPSATSSDNAVGCLDCHVAHGSGASMTNRSNLASLAGDSALLRLDDRGICQSCHNK